MKPKKILTLGDCELVDDVCEVVSREAASYNLQINDVYSSERAKDTQQILARLIRHTQGGDPKRARRLVTFQRFLARAEIRLRTIEDKQHIGRAGSGYTDTVIERVPDRGDWLGALLMIGALMVIVAAAFILRGP